MTEEEILTIAKNICQVENMGDLNRVITNLFANHSIPIKFDSLDELPRAIQQYECNHQNTVDYEEGEICVSCNKKLSKEE